MNPADSPGSVEVVDQPERRVYEISVDGRPAGLVRYRRSGGQIIFIHTEIDDAYAGRGLGARLAAHVLDEARRDGLRVVPICPFIAGYIRSHPAYQDLVSASPAG